MFNSHPIPSSQAYGSRPSAAAAARWPRGTACRRWRNGWKCSEVHGEMVHDGTGRMQNISMIYDIFLYMHIYIYIYIHVCVYMYVHTDICRCKIIVIGCDITINSYVISSQLMIVLIQWSIVVLTKAPPSRAWRMVCLELRIIWWPIWVDWVRNSQQFKHTPCMFADVRGRVIRGSPAVLQVRISFLQW